MLTAGTLVSLSDTLLTDLPAPAALAPRTHAARLWRPQRVVFTPDALDEECCSTACAPCSISTAT